MTGAPCCPPLAVDDLPVEATSADDASGEAVFAVEGMHCARCIRAVEGALERTPGIDHARVNYTLRRVSVEGSAAAISRENVGDVLKRAGYRGTPFDPGRADAEADREMRRLLFSLAVAGFAAMNIMLLSVSVWAGNASDITPETRDLFHWISALIALPAAAIAGRPFYESAFRALAARRLNMDVPITIGVVLALALSVYETSVSAEHAYFESAVMLLFFLLGGRVLEQAMRKRTRTLAGNLAAFRSGSVERIKADGTTETVSPSLLAAGDRIRLKPGDRNPVDGVVVEGTADTDQSMITGETAPVAVGAGHSLFAGALNLNAALTLEVKAAVGTTLIDEVQALLDKAGEARTRRLDLADRASRLYAPIVHGVALAAAVGWFLIGAGVHQAVVIATTVLIITCPCALALAVPAVQVAAAGALFRKGLFLNNGGAIERLGDADTVVFDKTGTLTAPEFSLDGAKGIDPGLLEVAARLAQASRHPLAAALARHAIGATPEGAEEVPGHGVKAQIDGLPARLGSAEFCDIGSDQLPQDTGGSLIAFRHGDNTALFTIRQALRPDARQMVDRLRDMGLGVSILSGDRPAAVRSTAMTLGIEDFEAGVNPADKIARIEALAAAGKKVVMVGDGLNDAPALAAAHVSVSPASAVDLAQAQADAVFLGQSLTPVADAIEVSRFARRLMGQNLFFAAAYNAFAVPLAVFGFVTPLIAALSMSASSLIVTANALRALPRKAAPSRPHARPVSDASPAIAREATA